MTKGKKRGFNKKAAHIRTAAAAPAVSGATTASATSKTRNKLPNEQAYDGDWSMLGLGSLGQITVVSKGTGMQELARNTRNKAAHWDQGSKLRDRPVAFVSGGYTGPVDEMKFKPTAPVDQPPLAITSTVVCTAPPAAAEMDNMQTSHHEYSSDHKSAFVPRDSPDCDSDSSTEVILFKGRNNFSPSHQSDKIDGYNPNARDMMKGKQRHTTMPDDHDSFKNPNCLDHLLVASDDENGSTAAIDDYIANILLGDTDDATKQARIYNEESKFASATRAREGTLSGTDGSAYGANDYKGDDVWRDFKDDSDALDDENKMAADIDDEHFARLLAKQEDLGFEAAELILLDGDSVKQISRNRDSQSDNQTKDDKGQISSKKAQSMRQLRRLKPRDGSYPSAEAVADAFEMLEVAGWGNDHNGFDLGLSDSELEATLLATWQKDSRRKRDRKKAREERRSQGLLGKNANANDARVKYTNGMGLDEIKSEFRGFLVGAEQSVTLPPMDAQARKIIHELAHRFGITSKSTGAGNQRRPTLVRKKGTLKFDESHFNGVFSRVGRHYFARLDAKHSGAGGPQKPRGGNNAAVVVRNGEIVGGSAPEIGQENKGRTMLERMGWSVGMALGAVDNKGMTQPIEHVVKRSKAGLG